MLVEPDSRGAYAETPCRICSEPKIGRTGGDLFHQDRYGVCNVCASRIERNLLRRGKSPYSICLACAGPLTRGGLEMAGLRNWCSACNQAFLASHHSFVGWAEGPWPPTPFTRTIRVKTVSREEAVQLTMDWHVRRTLEVSGVGPRSRGW